MPPVMGAAAFLIADAVGIPYMQIAKAAVLPAVLYFTGVWIMVHFEAKRLGLKGYPREQLPKAGKLMWEKGQLILPLLIIVVLLSTGFTTTRAALYGTLACMIVPYFRKNTRVPFKNMAVAYVAAGRSIISVACACGVAGIIVGMVTLTGLGLKIGEGLVELTHGSLMLTLFFTMITSIILGMGSRPSNLDYSTIAAPILIKMGIRCCSPYVLLLLRHSGDITPPVPCCVCWCGNC